MKEPAEYHISAKTGCVLEQPLTRLPATFAPWQDVMDNMWTLVEEKRVRAKVHELPVLDVSELKSFEELCKAHVQLAMICSAYVWQDGESGAPKVLPRAVAVPLCAVSERLGLPPILTYSDVTLMNVIIDHDAHKDGSATDHVKVIHSFTPLKDWNLFARVVVDIELQFAKAVPCLIEAARLSREADSSSERLASLLNEIGALTESMEPLMQCYRGTLDPDVFFLKMLPFLGGWDSASKVLPDGLIYEGVSEKPIQCTSPSAGQSLIMQACDCLLGNDYSEEARHRMEAMRISQLGGHRQFLNDLRDFSQVSACVAARGEPALIEAFNRVQNAARKFRSSHVGIVTSYVVAPSRRAFPPELVQEDNKKLINFLKSVTQSTQDQLIPDPSAASKTKE